MKTRIAATRRQLISGVLCATICGKSGLLGYESKRLQTETGMIVDTKRSLPPLPDREGFAGMFAGVAGDRLIVAGGANFPGGYPWEGGRKAWYADLFVLDSPDANAWARAPVRLGAPMAYGVSFSANGRVYFVGGETGPGTQATSAEPPRCVATVASIGFESGRPTWRDEAPLPEPLKDSCGTTIGDAMFVFGGVLSPTAAEASNRLYVLDSNSPSNGWRRAPDLPADGRFQCVAGTDGRSLFIYSGIVPGSASGGAPVRRSPYLREVWRYTPAKTLSDGRWTRMNDMPREAAAAPSPAIRTPAGGLAILSGARSADHAMPPRGHPGWCRDVLIHDPAADVWRVVRDAFEAGQAVVTAPSVRWADLGHVISGEIAPGRRTPAITTITISG